MYKTRSSALIFAALMTLLFCPPARVRAQTAATSTANEALAITSPPDNATVSVNQIQLEVALKDPNLAELWVVIYTDATGGKPRAARLNILGRLDRDKKVIPIALTEGFNRIEVSDRARPDVKAVVRVNYVPDLDVLGSVRPRSAEVRAGDTVICGQLQLASLNQTLALIKATPALADIAMRFRDPSDPLVRSTLGDDCGEQSGRDGAQKIAVADVLRAVLLRLEPNLQPKENLQLNQQVRKQAVEDLLTRTSSLSGQDKLASARADAEVLTNSKDDLGVVRGTEFSSLTAETVRKQILLLEQYLGNVTVQLKDKDGKVLDRVTTDRDGNYFFVIKHAAPTDAGGGDGGAANGGAANGDDAADATDGGVPPEYTVSSEADEYYTTRTVMARPGTRRRLNILIEDQPVSLLARALVGYEQAGASAAASEQTFFFNLYLNKSFPLRQRIDPDFGERLRIWGDFRINSVPQSGDATISDFATGGFATQISGLKVNEAARVFEFLGGMELRLTGNNALLPSFDRRTKQKFSLSLIGGLGSVTPLDSQAGLSVFRVFDDAPGLPPDARGKEFIAFARPDRDRFFRQYYVGARINTFFFNNYNVPTQRFPAQLDVMVGQNEFVSGGKLAGPVFRFDGFFPLPYEDYKFINLYATAMMRFGGARTSTPLILQPAPDGTVVPGANVFLFTLPHPSRDYYRIGFGVDFVSLADKILKATGK
ncbi:MAG TPA: hypothetical protein VFX96_15300 [Pyrinomonadaceae bacterium]|nr:hypothetical protein [Pyrinomonadaceae bacterium]